MSKVQASYNLSYWEEEVFFKGLDVVVIGSGIVGLSAAISIKELRPRWRVAVFERGPLPIGASTRNAGFACFGSMTELLEDCTRMGEDATWTLVEQRWRGLQRLRERLGDSDIDFYQNGGYELFRQEDAESFEACADHIGAFNRMLKEITGETDVFQVANKKASTFGFGKIRHLMYNKLEGQLHTGKMINGLLRLARAAGVEIITGLPIHKVENHRDGIVLNAGPGWTLHVPRLLVATNGLARQLLETLPVQPARNQVLVTERVPGLRLKGCFHYDRGYYYFRDIDGRVLLGGGRNLAEEEEQTPELGTTPLIRAALTKLLREVVLPGQDVAIDRWWSGVLGVGQEKRPIVRKISGNMAVAVRLGGMGIAIGTLIGEQGARLLTE